MIIRYRKQAINSNEKFDFLRELVEDCPDPTTKKGKGKKRKAQEIQEVEEEVECKEGREDGEEEEDS